MCRGSVCGVHDISCNLYGLTQTQQLRLHLLTSFCVECVMLGKGTIGSPISVCDPGLSVYLWLQFKVKTVTNSG